jgi:hypothetical protein
MSFPAVYNFKHKTNGYWTKVWQINNSGVPLDISDYIFEMEIRSIKGPQGKLLENLTIGSGITVVDAVNGKIQIEIPPMPDIKTTQIAFYDLKATVNGKGVIWVEGKITLDPGVSY